MTNALSDPLGAGGLQALFGARAAPDENANAQPSADFGRILDKVTKTTDAPPEKTDEQEAAAPVGAGPTFALHLLVLGAGASPRAAEAPTLPPEEESPDAGREKGATFPAAPTKVLSAPSEKQDDNRSAEAALEAASAPPAAFQPPAASPPPIQPPSLSASPPAPAQAAPASPQFVQPSPPPSGRLATSLASHGSNAPLPLRLETGGVDVASGQNTVAVMKADQRHMQEAIGLAPQEKASEPRREGGVEEETAFPLTKNVESSEGRIDAVPVLAASARRTPSSEPAPSAPLKIQVAEIVTHLPAVVAQTLIASPENGSSGRKSAPMAGPAMEPPPEKPAEPLKVLKFQVEPASLGAITVRMRVCHAKVEIIMDAESPKTSALLVEARDHLTSAIGEKGMTLESFKVGLNPPAVGVAAGQEGARADDRPAGYAGERGFANEERPDPRQKPHTPARDRQGRDEKTASTGPLGVIL